MAKKCVILAIQNSQRSRKMDEEYQHEEALKDIMVKNDRIKVLEERVKVLEAENSLIREGLTCSVEGKSYKIAEQCLEELGRR